MEKELDRAYIEMLETLEWSVSSYTDDGRVEIEKYSPAGEDFSVCVGVENFCADIREYADGFDIDEHIEMWIEARKNGVSGVPATRELVKDAEDIKAMLEELADAIENLQFVMDNPTDYA